MAGAAQGIVDFVRGFGERKRQANVRDAMRNYLTNPEAAIMAVNEIDPASAIALDGQRMERQAAQFKQQETFEDAQAKAFQRVTGYLRGLPKTTNYGAAIDGIAPFLKSGLGASDQDIIQWKQAITANPGIIDALDDDVNKARANAQFGAKTLTPGSALYIGGAKVGEQPFAPKYTNVRRGDGGTDVVRLDPNDAGPGGAADIPVPTGELTVDALRPHFVAQESGGDYTAVNKTTGALGAYQVMPKTGQALAKRLGLAWRPDMMTQNTPAAQRYQDAIGGAAIQEAVEASGGDAGTAFSYYYGGSDRRKWGPNTAKYRDEMMTRFAGGQPQASRSTPPGSAAVYSTPGKPGGAAGDKAVRNATPQEIAAAGYPEGAAAQIDANGKFVNMRTPPVGARPGGKNDPRRMYEESVTRNVALSDMLDDLSGQAAAILENPNLDSYTGNLQGRLPSFLSGGRNDFNLQVETLKTKVGLNALQTMREMSKTGGALGQVSNYENRMLQNSLANLDTAQSEGEFRKSLQEVMRVTRRAKKRLNDALTRMPGAPGRSGGASAPAAPAAPAVGTIARNPNTGARVRFNGKGWEPVR